MKSDLTKTTLSLAIGAAFVTSVGVASAATSTKPLGNCSGRRQCCAAC